MRQGLDYDFVEDVAEADFFLDTGVLESDHTLADYQDLLDRALARDLPMVCANPDLEVIRGGRRELCAGAVAVAYAEMGGTVRFHGKPDPQIYDDCLSRLGSPARGRVLGIGDSLRTDIAGAARAGIDSLFVAHGIHGTELGLDISAPPKAVPHGLEERLRALCGEAGLTPRAALVGLSW